MKKRNKNIMKLIDCRENVLKWKILCREQQTDESIEDKKLGKSAMHETLKWFVKRRIMK